MFLFQQIAPLYPRKENEKIEKYQGLRIELERLWQRKTFVIPIVICALGALSKKFSHYVDLLHLAT